MIINSINANVNFNAQIKRNWDGVGQDTKAEVLASYDNYINAIKAKKAQAAELDAFMHSDEIKPLLEKLPKADVVNIHNYCDETCVMKDAQFCDGLPNLDYLPYDDDSHEKFTQGGLKASLEHGEFDYTRKPNGELNREGIKNWLNGIINFLNN